MRYFFHVGYKGSKYRGWQKQINAISVQETIENILSKFLKEKIHCIGCGRTDAGVHASQYYFHIDTENDIDKDFIFAINKMLPSDIAVFKLIKVGNQHHAQHSALIRTYNYFIHIGKNPFLGDISSLYKGQLDVEKMQEAARLLIGSKDFRAFCKTPDRHNHTVCHVSNAQIFTDSSKNFMRFEISADRFLKGMIRIIVQQLVEIGQHKLSLIDFSIMLNNKITPSPLKLAYPQGLYLSEIKYSFISEEASKRFCPMLEFKSWTKV